MGRSNDLSSYPYPFTLCFMYIWDRLYLQRRQVPKLATPESPSLLGVIDHLKLIDAFTMRPSEIVRSSSSRISARCKNDPLCLFSIEARGRDYQYEITGISPNSCETSNVVPRVGRAKASHLWLAAKTFILSAVNVKCSGKGGASTSNTIQSACAAATGVHVHVSTRQILRLRRSNRSSYFYNRSNRGLAQVANFARRPSRASGETVPASCDPDHNRDQPSAPPTRCESVRFGRSVVRHPYRT
jgi:hypothetical protein